MSFNLAMLYDLEELVIFSLDNIFPQLKSYTTGVFFKIDFIEVSLISKIT